MRSIGARFGLSPGAAQALQISELELELKHGDRRIAFAAARTLAAQAPLSLSLISKAERGHRLLAHAIAEPVKPSALHLSGDMTIDATFGATCRACLHDFMLNAAALEGRIPSRPFIKGASRFDACGLRWPCLSLSRAMAASRRLIVN